MNKEREQELEYRLNSLISALSVAVAIIRTDHGELARMLVNVGLEAKATIEKGGK